MISIGLVLGCIQLNAQEKSLSVAAQQNANFELGSGLNFSFNEGDYQFKMSGMIQPHIAFERTENLDGNLFLNAKRSYFNFSGNAKKEKVSFFLQTDFSLTSPLLDAWIAFHPTENLNIAVGQKQSIANNREMMVMETHLQFPERSLLSTTYSQSGREFGLFIDYTFGKEKFAIVPQIAVTSGDGRNSFGVDSRDVDLGGLKYGARLDVYPLGLFTKGNDDLIADLAHESSPKLVIGAAASFNDGASNAVGEGHGEFFLYNQIGKNQLPDYRQLYSDILVKYKGFSLLGEYVVATATNLQGSFVDELAVNSLVPTQISEYLALGTALNFQFSYVTKSGYEGVLRFANGSPEFSTNLNSIVQQTEALTLGFSKYFKQNSLKIQAAGTSLNVVSGATETNTIRGELLVQLIF